MKRDKYYLNSRIQRGKLVYLEWLDTAAQSDVSGWADKDTSDEFVVAKMCTTGFVITRSKKSISISHTIDSYGATTQVLTIPIGCIEKAVIINGIGFSERQESDHSQLRTNTFIDLKNL